MVVRQGDIWWADMGEPRGAAPGYRRPVLVVQGNPLNASRIATVICAPITSQLKWADAPGNVPLPARQTCLEKDSVANVSALLTIDRKDLDDCVGHVSQRIMDRVFSGIDLVLGRFDDRR